MKTTILASIFIVVPAVALAQGLDTDSRAGSLCSSHGAQDALQNALQKVKPQVDQLTNYFADTTSATWAFTDYLGSQKRWLRGEV